MAKRVMFYCQHVLGMGHLVRSAEIVRALARDFSVLFVTGGEIPQEFRFPEKVKTFELIPLKTSPDFSDLQLCDSSWDMYETQAIRRESLLRAFDKFQPDILVTELFPFGRKQFSFELLPLLARARSRGGKTMIVSSIRDILVNRREQEEYEQRVCGIVNSFYDLVLVHGDEKFQTLGETFSRVADLQCPVAYTGYVVQQSKAATAECSAVAPDHSHKPTIVVSNGSGKCPSGHLLLQSVLRAAPLLQKQFSHQLQIFAGPLIPEDVYERLQEIAAPSGNVTLARYTPDLPALLRGAQLSISMAGYNTVMDILTAGVRSLVYPVTGNGDEEQSMRAGKLAAMGVLGVLGEDDFEPASLAQKIEYSLHSKPFRIHFNGAGAANSALLLKKYLALRNDSLAGASSIPDRQAVYAAGASF